MDSVKFTFLNRVCSDRKYTDTPLNRLSDISFQITDLIISKSPNKIRGCGSELTMLSVSQTTFQTHCVSGHLPIHSMYVCVGFD